MISFTKILKLELETYAEGKTMYSVFHTLDLMSFGDAEKRALLFQPKGKTPDLEPENQRGS